MTNSPQTAHKTTRPSGPLLRHPLLVIAFTVLVYFIGSIIGEVVSYVYPITQGWTLDQAVDWTRNSTIARAIQVTAFYGSMAGLLYWFVKKQESSFAHLGLIAPRIRDIGYALLAVVPYVAGYAVLLWAALALFPGLDAEQEQQLGFQPGNDPVALALTFACLVILPPIVEELTMRGFLFTGLLGRLRFVWAATVTSIIFAIAHLQFDNDAPLLWVAAIDTFVLSLILCYMRARTGSLWPGIILHGLKNGVAFMSLFVFHLS